VSQPANVTEHDVIALWQAAQGARQGAQAVTIGRLGDERHPALTPARMVELVDEFLAWCGADGPSDTDWDAFYRYVRREVIGGPRTVSEAPSPRGTVAFSRP
jgi:hypothetical protein